ncbi:MAG TPA: nuclear transport factor 2 family protein [Thermoleophilaceae bacterium]|jgi:ketosteroid isomerase-like protein
MGADDELAVRGFADAINEYDLEAALAVCHPEIEFLSVLAVSGLRYVGHDGIRQYFKDVASAWAEWRVEVHRTVPIDDGRMLIEMTMHARGKESGATLTEPTSHVWTIRDGKLLRNEPHRGPAAGVRR